MRHKWLDSLLLAITGAFLVASSFSYQTAVGAGAVPAIALGLPPDQEARCGSPNGAGPCFVYLPLISRPSYPLANLPVGFNSGGPEIVLSNGQRFAQDREYSVFNGAGYVAGEALASDFAWEPIENTDHDALYRAARTGMSAYLFNVPNGQYIVELHLAEIGHHGPQFRVFDVAIEGQQVLQALDIYALAQHDYAVRYRFAAEVQDGQLDISFAAATGEPLLSAIWVDQRLADSRPPAAPTMIHALGGYRRAIVRWSQVEEEDVAGYRVYRGASAVGPFQPHSAGITPLTRFLDDTAAAGQNYCYAVAAVDVYGNEGPRSPASCAVVVDTGASNLPVLHLSISAQNLRALAANPGAEVEVPAMLTVDGQHYDVSAEYRGRSTQYSNKKSWQLVANRPIASWHTDTLLLNGEGYDPAMIREKVAYDLYQASDIQPQQASFVHLTLNGEFIGVFTRVENPDRDFVQRTGRDAEDDVFKCYDGMDTRPGCTNQVVKGRSSGELYAFAALINRTPDGEFAAAIADVLDVRRFLDYQAISSVTSDADSARQFLLHRARSTGRWQVLPWDNNVTFADPLLPVDYGTSSNPGWGYQANVLLTRVLEVPQYRRYYGERLLDLIGGLFSPQAMGARLHATRNEIWFDAQRDVWKALREDNDAFSVHLSHLLTIVNQRVAYLTTAVPAYMPQQSRFISIDEVMPRNATTIVDPAGGQADPWFELFNAGLEPVDIGGMFLTNSPADPTRFRIPDGSVLPPLGALLFWADNQPQQGLNHVNFTLPPSGGQIHLFERNGSTAVDAVAYPVLAEDVAWGRFPPYSGQWLQLRQPTPGQPNRLLPPTISDVAITPRYPQAGEEATVTAVIVDDGSVSAASLVYITGGAAVTVPMLDDGSHGDGDANDGRYGARIPAFPNGRVVTYYISATDDYGRTAFDPAAAPELTHRYRVGLQAMAIMISEFMADNATTIEDPDEPGEYPDWIELVNLGEELVNLNGFYLTDDLQRPTKFRISADIMLAPGDTVLFWADGDPQQGPRHLNFKLSKQGEAVGLFHRDGATPIDTVVFTLQHADVAYGRCWAQGDAWEFLYLPTPGQRNACGRQYLPLLIRQ